MRLLSRLAVSASVAAVSLSAFVPQVGANHVQDVLGESTAVSEIHFPGLAAGPGFILPDSSLYPLDQVVQEIRLTLAFTPEQQAQVYMRILGERLGEAKVMMERDDAAGIEIALSGAEKAARGASRSIGDAAAKGRSTATLARDMNRSLAEYRTALREVANQAPLALASRIDATSFTLLEAKLRVEDELPGDELAAAIDADLDDVVETQVLGVKIAANNLMQKYNVIDARSKLTSEQKMKYEEAMASKSGMKKELIEQRKKILSENSEQRAKLLEERKKLYEQIKELMKQLQENQKAMQQLQQAQNSGAVPSVTPTVTPAIQ